MKCRELAALEKQHAELHYGKYSAGYNRGWTRAQDERARLAFALHDCRRVLRELTELNQECGGDLLPSEFVDRIEKLLE